MSPFGRGTPFRHAALPRATSPYGGGFEVKSRRHATAKQVLSVCFANIGRVPSWDGSDAALALAGLIAVYAEPRRGKAASDGFGDADPPAVLARLAASCAGGARAAQKRGRPCGRPPTPRLGWFRFHGGSRFAFPRPVSAAGSPSARFRRTARKVRLFGRPVGGTSRARRLATSTVRPWRPRSAFSVRSEDRSSCANRPVVRRPAVARRALAVLANSLRLRVPAALPDDPVASSSPPQAAAASIHRFGVPRRRSSPGPLSQSRRPSPGSAHLPPIRCPSRLRDGVLPGGIRCRHSAVSRIAPSADLRKVSWNPGRANNLRREGPVDNVDRFGT